MPPPASPLILGQHAPPPSPAHPPHAQQSHHTPQQQQAQARAHAQAQAQLLALGAEGRESDAGGASTHAAEDVDAAGGDDDLADDQQQMSDDDEDYEEEEDRASNSSQSCPPSPLASLANASTADANSAVGSGSGVLAGRRKQAASGRRRSVGSSSVHERETSEASGRVYKRPSAKVSQVAGSPAFKKKVGGDGASGAGGSSCHQCKSRRAYMDLTYCTSSLGKKKNAVCRKKFCEHCLKKFYRELPHPPGVGAGGNTTVWKCPSCRKICCCAACRRREMRSDDGTGGAADARDGTQSNDGTPMPTPLYRGESGTTHGRESHMQSSPLQSSSPSPTALSMQRLLLSPTGHPSVPSMSPLPTSSAMAHKLLLANSSMLSTPPHSQHHSHSHHSSHAQHTPGSSLHSSPSPPPPSDHLQLQSTPSTVASAQLASLTALSQAAMHDAPHHPHHSITISLQNHSAHNVSPNHQQQQQTQQHSHQAASSLAGSAGSSPNDLRSATVGAGGAVPSGGHGTPKATSTSLYSHLLLQNGVMLTPRSMPRAALPHAPAPPLSLATLKSSSSGASIGGFLPPPSLTHQRSHGSSGGAPMQLQQAQLDTSQSSNEANDDQSASTSSREEQERMLTAHHHTQQQQATPQQQSILSFIPSMALFYAVSWRPHTHTQSNRSARFRSPAFARRSVGMRRSLTRVVSFCFTCIPRCSVCCQLGELPSVQRDVRSILSAPEGGSNREKLKRIEEVFLNAADKVATEELQLSI